jgi:hypothetical protein
VPPPVNYLRSWLLVKQGHEGGMVYFILANPPNNRGSIIFPVEGNKFQVRVLKAVHRARPHACSCDLPTLAWFGCWLPATSHCGCLQVILFGYHDNPTADFNDFLNFAASLAAPDIYNMLKAGTPLTPVIRCECPLLDAK